MGIWSDWGHLVRSNEGSDGGMCGAVSVAEEMSLGFYVPPSLWLGSLVIIVPWLGIYRCGRVCA